MLTIAAAETIGAIADTTNVITMTMFGMELNAGVESYKTLYQGRITNSIATKYTAPSATQTFVKSIHLANTSASDVTGIIIYLNGTAAGQKICALGIPANGMAVMGEDGWRVYTASGELLKRISNLANTDGTRYQFATGTTVANPGVGAFSFNNATLTSATKMMLHQTTQDSGANAALLEASLNNKSCILRISNLLRTAFVTVIAHRVVADVGGWYEIDATVIQDTLTPVASTDYYLEVYGSQAGWAGRATNSKFNYTWSTTTSSGPASGTARLSTTTPHSVTDFPVLYLSNTDADGNDMSEFFNVLKSAGNTLRNAIFVTISGQNAASNGQRYRVHSGVTWTVGAGVSFTVEPQNPSNTMPTNATAVDVIFEMGANVNSDVQQSANMGAGAGLYGAPGYVVGGAITNYAWGTAAKLRGIPIVVKHPIMLLSVHMICSLITSGASVAKVGYSKMRPQNRSGTPAVFRLGSPIAHFGATTIFGSTGLKTFNLNNDILLPGYYFIYVACQALAQSAQCHALLTNSVDGVNFNGSVNPMLMTSEFSIATDYSGGGPTEGTTVVATTTGLSASFEQNFQMPFWLSWLPIS